MPYFNFNRDMLVKLGTNQTQATSPMIQTPTSLQIRGGPPAMIPCPCGSKLHNNFL